MPSEKNGHKTKINLCMAGCVSVQRSDWLLQLCMCTCYNSVFVLLELTMVHMATAFVILLPGKQGYCLWYCVVLNIKVY